MSSRRLYRLLSTAILGCTMPLMSQIVHSPEPSSSTISLDHTFLPPAADIAPVKGETSFANAPDNFYAFASARAGEPAPVEAVHLRFSAATTITSVESTKDFTIEPGGSCVPGQSYAKGDTCVALVRFTPQGAGRRLGKLTIAHSGSATPDAFGLGGYGYSPIVSFTPAAITTVPGTYPSSKGLLSGAPNLAVDGGDVLYIADEGNALLREIDSSGAITSITPFFSTPISITVDSFGIVWGLAPSGSTYYFLLFEPWSTQGADSATYVPATCTPSAPCGLGSVGMSNPAEISIDSNNNLFMEEATQGALEMPVGGYSGGNGTLDLWHLQDQYAYFTGTPSTFAVNVDDDLFTALSYPFENTCFILDQALYGSEIGDPTTYRVAGANGCGFSGDGGQGGDAEIGSAIGQMAFDIAGNLYFTDTNNQRVRRVSFDTGIINTIAGTGTAGYSGDGGPAGSAKLSYPTGLAVDSQGQVYIISGTGTMSGGAQVIRKLGPKGSLAYGVHTVGTSTPLSVTVSNVGNSTLVLTTIGFTGANPSDFSLDPTTSSCSLTAGATLSSGQSCQATVVFKPSATGTRSANLVFYDNTVTNANTVLLVGSGSAASVALAPNPLSFPSTTVNQAATESMTVTNSGNADLTVSGITVGGANPKMFTYTSACTGAIAPKASCKVQVTFKPTSAGSHSAILNVADNAPGSPHSISVAGSGLVAASASVQVTSSSNPAAACAPVAFSVTVSGGAGVVPSGTVELMRGGFVLASAPLVSGHSRLSAPALEPGSNLLSVHYSGDTTFAPSTSPQFTQMVTAAGSCVVVQPLSMPGSATR